MDFVFLLFVAALAALSVGLIELCSVLMGEQP
jgi:hypothetical protein